MNAKLKLSVIVGILLGFILPSFAQKDGSSVDSPPIVPITALVKGRQSVVDYLDGQVDHVVIHYSGASVVAAYFADQYYSKSQLRMMGYLHDGSFNELSSALASTVFEKPVVKTPDGNYDVQVKVTYYDATEATLMTSYGYLPISEDAQGNLYADKFYPWTAIHDPIEVQIDGYVFAAKWIGSGWGNSADLTVYEGPTSTIVVPLKYAGTGEIVWLDEKGNVSGWNQDTGAAISGRPVLAFLGKTSSGDERVIDDTMSIDGANYQFYQAPWDGRIYGRFPLTDVVSMKGRKEIILPQVSVWGQKLPMVPSHVYLKPLYMNAPSVMGYQQGVEVELQFIPGLGGGWILNVPPGEYKIRIEFDNLYDWDLDPISVG